MGMKLNNTWPISLIISLCFIFPYPAFAQEKSTTQVKPHYLSGRLGYSNITYPGELEEVLDLSETHIGGIGFDVAAYVPFPGSSNTIIGMNANGTLDSYTYPGFLWESASVTITHALFSLSSVHYFREIGSGPFVRADIGLSRLEIDVSYMFMEPLEATSNFGIGFLLGGGIAFSTSYNVKMLLNVDYSSRRVEGEDYKILSLNMGILY